MLTENIDSASLCKQFDESLQSEFKFQVLEVLFKKNSNALLESSWCKYAFVFFVTFFWRSV